MLASCNLNSILRRLREFPGPGRVPGPVAIEMPELQVYWVAPIPANIDCMHAINSHCDAAYRTWPALPFGMRASRELVQTLMMRRELDQLSAAQSVRLTRLGLRLTVYDVKVKPSAPSAT